jgi:predicted nuclease with TOPRIM domain
MEYQIIHNLTQLLLAEKEEKRQLYNRFKQLERHKDDLAGMVMMAQADKQRVKVLEGENASLDNMVAKLLDENMAFKTDNGILMRANAELGAMLTPVHPTN